ncbi:MAG: hypothetical protein V2A73_16145, partial [Pseudomonadota bacterium]
MRKLPARSVREDRANVALHPDRATQPALIADEPKPPSRKAVIEPLAPCRYKVELTVTSELRDKLERARGLLRHKGP